MTPRQGVAEVQLLGALRRPLRQRYDGRRRPPARGRHGRGSRRPPTAGSAVIIVHRRRRGRRTVHRRRRGTVRHDGRRPPSAGCRRRRLRRLGRPPARLVARGTPEGHDRLGLGRLRRAVGPRPPAQVAVPILDPTPLAPARVQFGSRLLCAFRLRRGGREAQRQSAQEDRRGPVSSSSIGPPSIPPAATSIHYSPSISRGIPPSSSASARSIIRPTYRLGRQPAGARVERLGSPRRFAVVARAALGTGGVRSPHPSPSIPHLDRSRVFFSSPGLTDAAMAAALGDRRHVYFSIERLVDRRPIELIESLSLPPGDSFFKRPAVRLTPFQLGWRPKGEEGGQRRSSPSHRRPITAHSAPLPFIVD